MKLEWEIRLFRKWSDAFPISTLGSNDDCNDVVLSGLVSDYETVPLSTFATPVEVGHSILEVA